MSMLETRRVVVTGLGPIAPNGIGKEAFWNANKDGVCAVAVDDEWDRYGFATGVFARIKQFDPSAFGLLPTEVRRMDRYCQMAVVAADLALADAELDMTTIDLQRFGTNIGTAVAGTKFMDEEFVVLTDGGHRQLEVEDASPYSYSKSMPNTASNEIAAKYGLCGTCFATVTGCTAGIDATGISYEMVRDGQADLMITGAAEAPLTPITIAAFDVIKAVSRRNDLGSKASRPFAAGRDGFVLSEGAGVLLLEELEHARRRHAPIYAEVVGYASTSNAYHMTGLPPDGYDLSRAICLCLERAGLGINDIDYTNAHGSSTYQNDLNETAAIKRVFGEQAYHIPMSSTKSMIGHSLGAASALEIIVTALSIKDDFIPPTVNYDEPSPECDLDYVPNIGRKQTVNRALSIASGFSGLHSAIVLAKSDKGAA